MNKRVFRVPLRFTPQAEGGYTGTSPVLPELITEGDTLAEALAHAEDALQAVVELYEDAQRPLPIAVCGSAPEQAVEVESLLSVP
ncbi:MAG: type II toxin-antitoxin system HicB family antitoxin [Candidatus Latescibacterota bacterium]|jgi:antitoxin HicB